MIQKITSRDNEKIKQSVKLLKSAKDRREQNAFIIEGARLCDEALKSGAQIEDAFFTETASEKFSELFNKAECSAENIHIVSDQILALLSDTKTPQGMVFTVTMLDKKNQFDTINRIGNYIALENISDPNNLGTILRTAEALGIDGVILSEDCCDIYSPKVVRGSMGAVFRVKVQIESDMIAWINKCNSNGMTTLASVPDCTAEKITDLQLKGAAVMLVGNEANGLTQEAIQACNSLVTIPMNGDAESLNASVAASILMWEMVRKTSK
ncbi:MAG: RNA methyltransferase [Bacillota bacterium]|nr:RNA methyltransferase [Bacillota bacterium]